jgi:ribonuclease E
MTAAPTAEPAAPSRARETSASGTSSARASDAVAGASADVAPAAKRAPVKRTRRKATTAAATDDSADTTETPDPSDGSTDAVGDGVAAPARRRRRTATATPFDDTAIAPADAAEGVAEAPVPVLLFQPPPAEPAPRKRAARPSSAAAIDGDDEEAGGDDVAASAAAGRPADSSGDSATESTVGAPEGDEADGDDDDESGGQPRTGTRRRRGRRGRGGRGGAAGQSGGTSDGTDADDDARDPQAGDARADHADETDGEADGDSDASNRGGEGGGTSASSRRRRRRRRTSVETADGEPGSDDPPNTVVHVREPRKAVVDDGVRGVKGSTRIEAKRQRRRDGRDTSRRRPTIITEAEFLARREAVDRVMVVRQGDERTQIAVLEDGILVEHYVTRKDSASMVGNVYLGRVQNVLPSMEAAFVDIGRGRNAVLYAGEVNYDASALEGRPPRIEQALKSGQSVLVQVTKDPIGHKGGRLTSQVSLPGRYMVYVPDGRLSGISRKLPDTERSRLKGILKRLTPEDAGVIIRTAAEGASEEALERDLSRLKAQWEVIDAKSKTGSAPSLIYGEPDLVIRVVRDIFNEDFSSLVVQGADEWDTIDNYVRWVAPDLAERTSRWSEDSDVFDAYRVDEQLAKALDRKVWLPSGGYLVIDRTEAMVVIDVNTGKFTGKGGNLEETVTKNNIEAAEEIVRQLRLRDLGGIIVIDFIDMVLESNRDLVLRRLLECLGRDRTRHQVAEVTSLGLVQMTRKRVGEGLLESFSETCKECGGSGVILTIDPVAAKRPPRPIRAPKPTAIAASARRSPRRDDAETPTGDVETPTADVDSAAPANDSAAAPVVADAGANGAPPDSDPTAGAADGDSAEATANGATKAAPAKATRRRRTPVKVATSDSEAAPAGVT